MHKRDAERQPVELSVEDVHGELSEWLDMDMEWWQAKADALNALLREKRSGK
jgi:hypothetical protein